MVRLAQIIGAAALLSHSVLAAPAMRRMYDDSSKQNDNSYGKDDSSKKDDSYQASQPAQYGYGQDSYNNKGNEYNTPPSYDNKYTSEPSYDNKYTSEPSYDNKYTTDEATKAMEDMTTSSAYEQAMYTTSTDEKTADATSAYDTTSAYTPAATYGSGQNNWGMGYDDCVSKCVAQYGSPPMEWKPSESMAPPPDSGNGVVHTVMVAPMEGVLRYWPFAVNASVGDTIRYVWTTPLNHTATLSSALTVCNKSAKADELKWVSGIKNASDGTPQTFDVTIQTDETQFFYCSVAQHCNKGMFGMVQPKMGGNNTVSFYMDKWLESNPDLKAAWANVHQQTKDTPADTWGNNMSVDGIPEESYMDLAKNIMWNRAMFAANPGSLEANSAVTSDNSPIKLVGDLNTLLASTSQDPPTSVVPQGTPTGAVPDTSAAASQLANTTPASGAGFKTSVPVWVAAFVGAVSYLVL